MELSKLYPICDTNPIVYLDVKIGQEYAGRMIIELRADVVPKTAENFRCLCTGERGIGQLGKPLHYKGIRFHKVQRIYAVQSGDIVNNDGTGGESIYGPVFEDENFELEHKECVLSMRNFGTPNTNNSQFVITTIACANLDGTNVVFGRVLRGTGVLLLMEEFTNTVGQPSEDIIISDCGQLSHAENLWGMVELDDLLPLYPLDYEDVLENYKKLDKAVQTILNIRSAGNEAFCRQSYYDARRKYRKAMRYTEYFYFFLKSSKPKDPFNDLFSIINLNLATVEFKLGNYKKSLKICNEALLFDKKNAKIFYRTGQVQAAMLNYDEAIEAFKAALSLDAHNKTIENALKDVILEKKKFNSKMGESLKKLF